MTTSRLPHPMSGKEAPPPYREELIAAARGSIGQSADYLTKTLDALAISPTDRFAVSYALDALAYAITHQAVAIQTLIAFDSIPYPVEDADLVEISEEPIPQADDAQAATDKGGGN